jgi:hypothetical protein
MAGRRPYNEKRSELNVECREKLSQQLRKYRHSGVRARLTR